MQSAEWPLAESDTTAWATASLVEAKHQPWLDFVSEHHALSAQSTGPVKRPVEPGWVFIPLIITFLITGYMRWSMPKRFSGFLRALIDGNQAAQIHREDNGLNQRIMAALSTSGAVNIALLSGHFLWQNGILGESAATLSLITLTVFGLFFFAKSTAHVMLGLVTGADRQFSLHNFNQSLFMSSLGLALTPLTAIAFLGPSQSVSAARWAAMAITAVSYIMLQWRGAFVFMRMPGISALHLIYYLCAFEIAPLSIAYRVINTLLPPN